MCEVYAREKDLAVAGEDVGDVPAQEEERREVARRAEGVDVG